MSDQKPDLTPEQKKALLEKRRATQSAAPVTPAAPPVTNNANSGRSLGVLVFLGSLLGSLIGTVASIDDLLNSFGRVNDLLNPPPTLCITGSNTILGDGLGLAEAWEADFEGKARANVIIDNVGSIGGVNKAAAGECVHVLAMSEALPIAQAEQLTQAGVEIQCAAEIGYDILAFVTDINNRLPALEDRYLNSILDGRAINWREVRGQDQTIYIYVRPNSGTTDYVLQQYGWRFASTSNYPPNANYLECSSNDECLDATLATRGSLYWVSVAWMKTQPPQYLRVLPILRGDEAPINPLTENVDIREYPQRLIRPLYMYVLKRPDTPPETLQLAQDFLRYVRGVQGQKILEDRYFKAYFNQPVGVDLDFPTGFTETAQGPRQVCR
jgi:ABC-type phosphate transport system substrate-binding protein